MKNFIKYLMEVENTMLPGNKVLRALILFSGFPPLLVGCMVLAPFVLISIPVIGAFILALHAIEYFGTTQ